MSQVVVSALGLSTLGVACGGSSTSTTPPPDASTSDVVTADVTPEVGSSVDSAGVADGSSASGDDGSTSGDDGGGGQVVEDGGSNLILDGGDDGGGDTTTDGGACNAITNPAPAVTSDCASLEPILAGGQLVAGTYYLAGVTTYGTAAFCKNTFIPVSIKETAEMTVIGEVGTADTVSQLATTAPRRASITLTPGANNATPLTEQITCPVTTGSQQVKYDARTNAAAKMVLVLRLPYGKGEADYRFEKQ